MTGEEAVRRAQLIVEEMEMSIGELRMLSDPFTLANLAEWNANAAAIRFLLDERERLRAGSPTQADVDTLTDAHGDDCMMYALSDYPNALTCTCGLEERIAAIAERFDRLLNGSALTDTGEAR